MLRRLLFLFAGCLWATPALAGERLVARFHPGWSPYARDAAPAAAASLVQEARELMATDPARVAQVLASAPLPAGPAGRLIQGLQADALYFVGGDQIHAAQRRYRDLAAGNPGPGEAAWLACMEGTIHQGLGFAAEAETAYRAAVAGPPGPWSAALFFNVGVLALEGGQYALARERFLGWLEAYGGEPGRALVLALLGECEAALGNRAGALQRFEESRRGGAAVFVRPSAAHALAEALRQAARVPEAVAVLEVLADGRQGTAAGAVARLAAGAIWEAAQQPARAAKGYAQLLDQGVTPAEAQEARLRLALLGVAHRATLELAEPLPAYRILYRPKPTLEEFAEGRDPVAAQRALRGLADLARADADVPAALGILTRSFRTFPESPESGRAYEEFMELLEAHLADRLAAGAPGAVLAAYEAFRGSIGWAPTRDTGAVALRAAEAYEALGAPRLARRAYEDLAARGTRQVTVEDLEARTTRVRAAEGDAAAVRRWAARPGADWKAHRALARSLARDGAGDEARARYREAAKVAPGSAETLALLAEGDALGADQATTAQLLGALEARRRLWSALPPGAERDAWGAHGRVVEGRLRVAAGDWAGATRAYGSAAGLETVDAYLLALAEARRGRAAAARELLGAVVAAGDPIFSPLAALSLEVEALRAQEGRP